MLILKAYINSEKIDEIHIWNTDECTNPELNMWKYQIVKPEGFEDWYIIHKQDDGYMPLLAKVLEIITKHGDKNKKCVGCGEKTENKIVDKPICIDCMVSITTA